MTRKELHKALMASRTGWIAVHAGPNWRVWNTETKSYHRGTDGAVRVYRDADPAQRRAEKLNEREDPQP